MIYILWNRFIIFIIIICFVCGVSNSNLNRLKAVVCVKFVVSRSRFSSPVRLYADWINHLKNGAQPFGLCVFDLRLLRCPVWSSVARALTNVRAGRIRETEKKDHYNWRRKINTTDLNYYQYYCIKCELNKMDMRNRIITFATHTLNGH